MSTVSLDGALPYMVETPSRCGYAPLNAGIRNGCVLNKGWLYGELIALDLERIVERHVAADSLEQQLHYQRATVAQLAATLAALRQSAPKHPLHVAAVMDGIHSEGERTTDFHQAWSLNHDSAAILADLTAVHEAARLKLFREIGASDVTAKMKGWLRLREVGVYAMTVCPSKAHAQRVKAQMLRTATSAGIDHSHKLQM